jgi:hypothetical protein
MIDECFISGKKVYHIDRSLGFYLNGGIFQLSTAWKVDDHLLSYVGMMLC